MMSDNGSASMMGRRLEEGPAKRPSLVEQVRDYVKSFVQSEGLRPGDQLPSELELAKRLGVSRGAVREAVTSLKSMGIVEVRHGNGLFLGRFSFEPLVTSLPFGLMGDQRPLSELVEIRRVLEVALIAQVVDSQTPAHMDAVRRTLARMKASADRNQSLADADRQFHKDLFGVLDNKMLLELLDVFWFAFDQARRYIDIETTDPRKTYEAHARIADAVEAREVEAARQAVEAHYVGIVSRLTPRPRALPAPLPIQPS